MREIFQGDLDEEEASELIDRAISKCQRSRLKPFVKFSRTLREHKEGILASIRLGISNARAEALTRKLGTSSGAPTGSTQPKPPSRS